MARVSVLLRIRENGKYPFVTPVWLTIRPEQLRKKTWVSLRT